MAKVMISIPDDLLHALDAEAQARHTSRSALLATAALRELNTPNTARAAQLLARARSALADSGEWSAADLVRAQRASH